MNFGVIEDCNFIMSYCELVNKIKAEPLKYIDEYNLVYLRNYLDGYEYFKYLNAFNEKILELTGCCLTFFIQSKVIKIGNEHVKNEYGFSTTQTKLSLYGLCEDCERFMKKK